MYPMASGGVTLSLLKNAVLFTSYLFADESRLPLPDLELPPIQESGWSTSYGFGEKWYGNMTASGERFPSEEQTCAHRTIPLHEVVLVEHQKTGVRVWCRVNDRGPYGALDAAGNWFVKRSLSAPGTYRGVMDLSQKTVEAMHGKPGPQVQDVHIRYFPQALNRVEYAFNWY